MAKYLVTGGAGFIGSNIVHELVKRRQRVVVLDNLSTGKKENLNDLSRQVRFIKGDIRDLATVRRACRGVGYVLHQAALRAVERSVDDPSQTNDTNITGTLNVLLAARAAGVRRVVFASSSSVYGDVRQAKQVETLPAKPASPYALSKLTGEHYCRLFSELYGLETVALRYFNVFGPRQNPESKYSAVIPILVNRLLRGERPEIHWNGRQSRDFTYVENVVQANIKAVVGNSVKSGEVYNIGSGENTAINELYKELQRLLDVEMKPKRTGKRMGDVYMTFANINKAKRDFKYVPAISFKDGLKKSIKWYQANR